MCAFLKSLDRFLPVKLIGLSNSGRKRELLRVGRDGCRVVFDLLWIGFEKNKPALGDAGLFMCCPIEA